MDAHKNGVNEEQLDQLANPQAVNADVRHHPDVSSDAYFRAAAAILATRANAIDTERTAALLKRHYGLTGEVSTLSSEVEQTDRIALADGRLFILKISTQPEAMESFHFQSSVIDAVDAAPGFISPKVLKTRGGALMFQDEGVCGYLQTCVEGIPLHQVSATPDLLFRAGAALGQLNLALKGIDVPAIHRPVLWHIGCWPRLLDLGHYLPSGPVGEQVRAAMRDHMAFAVPQLSALAWQVTHNDPSPFNSVLTENGVGFIDFGDGCWGPRIQDLAIAASHFVTDKAHALGGAEYLIAGYASVIPLSSQEKMLLVGLMRARQSALILINAWRSHLFPAEARYINKNVPRAERGLAILSQLSAAEAEAAVQTATRLLPT